MKGRKILDEIQHEVNVLKGEEAKNKTYSSQHTFPDEQTAREAFARSKEKLFHVDRWSDLSSFTADFRLHDQAGNRAIRHYLQVGDYIKIEIPGPMPENWVKVTHVVNEYQMAQFTVQPSNNPQQNDDEKIEHFFQQEARSTFRIELEERTITASEIGRNEAINNQGPESGNRAFINTLIAEAGWLFHQPIQWKVLTDYLVHPDA